MEMDEKEGLLDSGATHALRGKREKRRFEAPSKDPGVTSLWKEDSLEDDPWRHHGIQWRRGWANSSIGAVGGFVGVSARMGWERGFGGPIPTSTRGGCRHVSKEMALMLIEELEETTLEGCRGVVEARKIEGEKAREEEWIGDLVRAHPVLSQLPDHIKEEHQDSQPDHCRGKQEEEKEMAEAWIDRAPLLRSRWRVHVVTSS